MYKTLFSFGSATVLFFLCVPQGCVAQELAFGSSIWWAPDLQLASVSDIDRAMAELVTDNGQPASVALLAEGGRRSKTVHTCNEYLEATDQKMAPANSHAPVFPFINPCYVLRYLKSVQAPGQSFLGSGWSDDLLKHLPPFVVYAENDIEAKADKARERNESWERFDPQMKMVTRTDRDVVIEDNHDRWRLTIVARGDFNQDGLEDQVVIACDTVRFGSGGMCLPLVLTASSPEHVMTLLSSLSEPYNIVSSSGAR